MEHESNRVFCIIVTYNAMRWIDKCLKSLSDSTIPIIPVIVDNNSKDETVSYLKNNYKDVHLIVNKKNKGFGQANNQGIEYAYKNGATHFFLLNQDAWVEKSAIERLVFIQNKYNIALVSPIHMNDDGSRFDYSYFVKIVIDECNIEYISDLLNNTLKPYYKVEKINAAAWLLSRNTIETIGGFDPIYFHYGEDGNYCQRLHYHNEDVVFVPDSIVHHDRIKQGNISVYNKNSTLMFLLFYYTDINSHFFYPTINKFKLHLLHIFDSFRLLFSFKLLEFKQLFMGYVNFFIRIPLCFKSMKVNRSSGPNWLDLN